MKRYKPVALYLLIMAAVSLFIYVDGSIHWQDRHFLALLLVAMDSLSLVLAGIAAWMIKIGPS